MTHEEQIKWMTDRIAHLETQYESAMGMVETLMGKLKPLTEKASSKGTSMIDDDDDIQEYKKPWVGLTYEDQEEIVLSAHSIRDAINKTDQKLKEKNT